MIGLRKRAVALRYDAQQELAPVVIAKGQGYIAQKIIELAEQHGIRVQQDPALVELLLKVELNAQIPPQLYAAVSKVLAAVYRVDRELARRRGL